MKEKAILDEHNVVNRQRDELGFAAAKLEEAARSGDSGELGIRIIGKNYPFALILLLILNLSPHVFS